MLDVLGEAAFRNLLLATTVQLGLWVFRIHRAQLLLVTWTVVLAASLAMPALQWATPVQFPIVPGYPAGWLISVADRQQQAMPATSSGPTAAVDVQTLPTMTSVLSAGYLLVSSIMLLRLIVGLTLSARLLSKAAPIYLNSAPDSSVRISQAVAAPVTVGNVILLPPDVVDWPPAMRRAAIAHECAHVARRDFALLVLSQLNRALFWFNPVSWLLHRRLAELAELASDDHAMRVTGDRTGYAEVLLEMGRRSGPLLRGLAMARASTLQYRIERILSDGAETSPVSLLQRSMVVVGAVVVSIVVASPDLNPGRPGGAAIRGPLQSPLAISDSFASGPVRRVNVLPRPSPLPSRVEDDSRPVLRNAVPLPKPIRVTPPQPSAVQAIARPVSRLMVSNAHPSTSAHPAAIRDRATDTPGRVVGRPAIEASSRDTEVIDKPVSQRQPHTSLGELSLLKVIDQQTCDGAYLPGPVGGPLSPNRWLNMVRAKFFREADGTRWLKFYLNGSDPVNLPVTVTDKEVEFTATNNTSFKMLPQNSNHLTGTTQRPYGTVDFACGEAWRAPSKSE